MLMATCTGNDIVNHVLPFIRDSISNADWKFRDAAVMAFGKYNLFLLSSANPVSHFYFDLLLSLRF